MGQSFFTKLVLESEQRRDAVLFFGKIDLITRRWSHKRAKSRRPEHAGFFLSGPLELLYFIKFSSASSILL
jgi:hypothetical protein